MRRVLGRGDAGGKASPPCGLSHGFGPPPPPPGHFYCSLHYPNPPGMDLPQDEPLALPDGVSHRKYP